MTLGKFLHRDPLSAPSQDGTLHTRGHVVVILKTGILWSFHFSGGQFMMTPSDRHQLGLWGRLGCLAAFKLNKITDANKITPLARPPGKSA